MNDNKDKIFVKVDELLGTLLAYREQFADPNLSLKEKKEMAELAIINLNVVQRKLQKGVDERLGYKRHIQSYIDYFIEFLTAINA